MLTIFEVLYSELVARQWYCDVHWVLLEPMSNLICCDNMALHE